MCSSLPTLAKAEAVAHVRPYWTTGARPCTFELNDVPHMAQYSEKAFDLRMVCKDIVFAPSSTLGDWLIEVNSASGAAVEPSEARPPA